MKIIPSIKRIINPIPVKIGTSDNRKPSYTIKIIAIINRIKIKYPIIKPLQNNAKHIK